MKAPVALLSFCGLAATSAFVASPFRSAAPAAQRRFEPAKFGFTDQQEFVPWKERDAGARSPLQREGELDPELLNDLFRTAGADRLRETVKPLAGFAAIFRLETLVDLSSVHKQAWSRVADRFMWRQLTEEEVSCSLTMLPERAIMEEFYWTFDWNVAQQAAEVFREEFDNVHTEFLKDLESVPLPSRQGLNGIIQPETVELLETLREGECQVAVVSSLKRDATIKTLDLAGITHVPKALITPEDKHDRDQQALLGAAYKLEAAPERCLVFELTPAGAMAAHEAGMRVVCVIGGYARYELHLADMTISSFADLNALSFKRIFADVDFDPEPALQPLPEPERRRPVRVATKTRVATRGKEKTPKTETKVDVPDFPPRRSPPDEDSPNVGIRRKIVEKV
mmetsp:Transcript_15273/g.58087  ORF Transcript_15273/g.58087 Transcript_15273/m.58087 type:complete len:397 (-) Transcript_15273:80-1270(-)|eukprot:scaffold819_cov239-Pinguiococcus_pyrenoidosus.AAC.8